MCRELSREETARVLETMADLFTWRGRRARLVEAAAVLRGPPPRWRPGAVTEEAGRAAPEPALSPAPRTA